MAQRDPAPISGNATPRLAAFLSIRFASVVVLQTALLIIVLGVVQARVIATQARHDNVSITTTMGRQINNFLAQELRTLSQFASILSVVPVATEQFEQLLIATMDLLDGAVTIIAIDERGRVLAGAPALQNADGTSVWDDVSVADRKYFQIPMQEGRSFVSPLFRGRGYGRDLLIALSVPVPVPTRQPGSTAVMEASVPLSALIARVEMLLPPDGRAYAVLSPDGVVALASEGLHWPTFSILPRTLAKQFEQLPAATAHWIDDETLGNQRWLVSRHPMPDDWQLIVMLPRSVYTQQVRSALTWPSVASLSIGLLLLIGVRAIARKLGREGDRYATKIESLTPEALGTVSFPTRTPRVAFREAGRVYLAVADLVTRMRSALQDQRATSEQLEAMRASLQRQVEAQESEIQSRTSMLLTSSSELRESQQLLEDAQVTGRIGIWSWVPAKSQIFLSSGAQRLLDTPPMRDHLPLETMLTSVVAEDRDRARKAFENCRVRNASLAITFQVCDDRGRNAWLLMRGAHGRASGTSEWVFRGTILDITERYLAEQRLTRFADGMEQLWRACVLDTTDADRIRGLLDAARCVIGAAQARIYLFAQSNGTVLTFDQRGSLVVVRRRDEYPTELFPDATESRIDATWLQSWGGENVVLARANAHQHCIGLLFSRLDAEPIPPAAFALVGLAAQLITHTQSLDHCDALTDHST